jgi:hypothetical protein
MEITKQQQIDAVVHEIKMANADLFRSDNTETEHFAALDRMDQIHRVKDSLEPDVRTAIQTEVETWLRNKQVQ